MKVQAIVAAAGLGMRLGAGVPKPFVMIHGTPLIVYTLRQLQECSLIAGMIVVVHQDYFSDMEKIVSVHGLSKVVRIVPGGEQRSDSVRHGLQVLEDDTRLVLIHDGARPLITVDFLNRMIQAAQKQEALIAAVPVKPTIKQVNGETLLVERTLDRRCLWDIQTPQIFQREVIEQAYALNAAEATDDAFLVEQLGVNIKIFPGLDRNIKVTTREDLILAEQLLAGTGPV